MCPLGTEFGPTIDPPINDMTNKDIDKIIRGEFSAVNAYDKVIEKSDKMQNRAKLRQFKTDHYEAAKFWQAQARTEGNVPENTSGAWGQMVDAFVETSKLLGTKTAFKTLKNGEEHGLQLYEEMLESDEINAIQKRKIYDTFIPLQKQHINALSDITLAES